MINIQPCAGAFATICAAIRDIRSCRELLLVDRSLRSPSSDTDAALVAAGARAPAMTLMMVAARGLGEAPGLATSKMAFGGGDPSTDVAALGGVGVPQRLACSRSSLALSTLDRLVDASAAMGSASAHIEVHGGPWRASARRRRATATRCDRAIAHWSAERPAGSAGAPALC